MSSFRVIPLLTLFGEGLVKTTNFKDPKYVGDPLNVVKIFNEKRVDELILLDIGKGSIQFDLIENIAEECFIPLTYGGKISSLSEARKILKLGIEKISINKMLFNDPQGVKDLVREFGSSTILASLDFEDLSNSLSLRNAKYDFKSPKEIVAFVESLGVGEILISDISREGTLLGVNPSHVAPFLDCAKIPILYSGGINSKDIMRTMRHIGFSGCGVGAYFVYYGPHKAVLVQYENLENDL